jgi:phosphate acetyltransferase
LDIIAKFRNLAKSKDKTILLPEGEEERVIKAAIFLTKNNLVKPILLGDAEKIKRNAESIDFNNFKIAIINPSDSDKSEEWAEKFYELRKHKGMTLDIAKETIMNPLYFGAFMLRENLADGAVAGSINTTGDVLRAAIQIVGLAPDVNVVSSSFIMALKDGKILTFADCAVIPDPDQEQLASIAISSAMTHRKLIEEDPIVALLSFSTKGSAEHPVIEKVLEAKNIVQQKSPDLKIDGELQFDAAFIESIGKKKAPDSPVAGKANVYIFPDLNSGNIGYKLAERIGGAEAIGPVIQGLGKPYNDLSRGCSVDDIINVACICAILS